MGIHKLKISNIGKSVLISIFIPSAPILLTAKFFKEVHKQIYCKCGDCFIVSSLTPITANSSCAL